MSNVIAFKPKHQLKNEKNLQDFIDRARNDLKIYEDQGGFNVTNWRVMQGNGRSLSMDFTGFASEGKKRGLPMQQPYLDFARAYMRDLQTWKERNPASYMLVLKCVYEALLVIHNKADILLMDGNVLNKTIEFLESKVGKDVLYRAGQSLEKLIADLVEYGINYKIPIWKSNWKRPREKAIRTDLDSMDWQERRLLTDSQIHGLADSFRLAKTRYQEYYSSLIVLLMATPCRAGELQFLTTDCLVEDEGRVWERNKTSGELEFINKKVLKINWYAEKNGRLISKPIHPLMEETVKEAISRLVKIGEPARKAAQWAIDNPEKFYRHDGCITPSNYGEDEPLTIKEFCAAMDLDYNSVPKLIQQSIDIQRIKSSKSQKWIKDLIKGKEYVTYRDLAKFTIEKYRKKFRDYPRLSESNEYISSALCLVRENEFHIEYCAKHYSFEIPNINLLNDALGAKYDRLKLSSSSTQSETLFGSLGIKDENGDPLVLTSHQIRVWLSTQAERGGMDAYDLARFAGRARISDNKAYDLRPMKEKLNESRKILEIATEREDGTRALNAVEQNLPVSFEMLGNKNRIGTVTLTAWGFCEHDWWMTPCSKSGECLSCREHACVKGLPKSLEKLKEFEQFQINELQRAYTQVVKNKQGNEAWYHYHARKLAIIKTLITMMEKDDLPDGYIIRIPKELDESMIKTALQGHELESKVEKSSISNSILKNTEQNFLAILQGEL
ncbi:hypothetical protein [Moraxella ovis]|uniref:hypothetical protein n=1 Tax=Moraxella ovis TaxID=29433 RepID=UPI000D89372B|nr:hypothetical protein [Moraxella ovis]SPX82039.1 Uncharacterized protein conserved in bacteria [Moraxella ovis]STZ05702.1 Uncharacterized protein conserved in bacteria [Moraxella ovis]